jgi:hypothetical protein
VAGAKDAGGQESVLANFGGFSGEGMASTEDISSAAKCISRFEFYSDSRRKSRDNWSGMFNTMGRSAPMLGNYA